MLHPISLNLTTEWFADTFLEFLGAVRDSGSLDASVGPAVVHCSAGIGRSGTFVLVDSCLVMVREGDCNNKVS